MRVTSRQVVILLLAIQAGLLGYSATCHGPTHLEPAFLASGISHWKFERFELYRVNPPLVRMIAALPVLAAGFESDWSSFFDGPGSRAEFSIGDAFVKANGVRSLRLFWYARWACIPFSLMGSSLDWEQGSPEVVDWIVASGWTGPVEWKTRSFVLSAALLDEKRGGRSTGASEDGRSHVLAVYHADSFSDPQNAPKSERVLHRFRFGTVIVVQQP